ncbi:universal stress protein [Herbidospora cretacea]|uniref:universal stress protein n=1 Tax=Herbidospora cretacea TaxID=28444 RepID=UPI0007C822B4|nr:universal stress protein [Herbidospora cretacea]
MTLIVAGVDGSVSALAAVEYAAADAARRNAALRIVHVRERWTGLMPTRLTEIEHSYGQEVLVTAERLARAREPGIETATDSATGDVVTWLKEEADKADAIVIGSRGMGGFAGLLLGSVGQGLAGHVPGPVVVVREPALVTYGRILVGYDGTEEADVALDFAFAEAGRRGAGLKVVFSWQPPPFSSVGTMYDNLIHTVYEERTTYVEERFTAQRERWPEVPADYAHVYGHPVNLLCGESATADLAVVGSRGLNPFGALALGSVGHGLLHHARCPVAVVTAA